MGEFASVLPDYHKPDIMTLITSYMDPAGGVAGGGVTGREERGGGRGMKRQISSSGKYVWNVTVFGNPQENSDPLHKILTPCFTLGAHTLGFKNFFFALNNPRVIRKVIER